MCVVQSRLNPTHKTRLARLLLILHRTASFPPPLTGTQRPVQHDRAPDGQSHDWRKGLKKSSKVSALAYLLCKVTIQRTFERTIYRRETPQWR
jgi:hypothetical protein